MIADDITNSSSRVETFLAIQQLQFHLRTLRSWVLNNNPHINTSKKTATLFTPDPAQCNQNITIDNKKFSKFGNPTFSVSTFNLKLTYFPHINSLPTLKPKATYFTQLG